MRQKFAKYMPMGKWPEKTGYALQTSISRDQRGRTRFFIEMAPQVGPKPKSGSSESPFDWKQKKFISLDAAEMGNIMACFRGRLKEVKIIHKFPMDAPPAQQKLTGLTIKQGMFNDVTNWGISLMQKMGDEKPETYQLYLNPGEVEVLMIFLSTGIAENYEL